jgi:hypothetical protein
MSGGCSYLSGVFGGDLRASASVYPLLLALVARAWYARRRRLR